MTSTMLRSNMLRENYVTEVKTKGVRGEKSRVKMTYTFCSLSQQVSRKGEKSPFCYINAQSNIHNTNILPTSSHLLPLHCKLCP